MNPIFGNVNSSPLARAQGSALGENPHSSPVLFAGQGARRVAFSGLDNSVQPGGRLQRMPVRLHGQTVNVAWREYGNPHASRVIVAVHGLTRNSLDFDALARYLATTQDCRVICPDIVGRGESEWFSSPRKGLGQRLTEITGNNLAAGVQMQLQPWRAERTIGDWGRRQADSINPSPYDFNAYEQQMSQMFEAWRLQGKQVTWIGTSMGGLIGLRMAAQPRSPIGKLVLNDVGTDIGLSGMYALGKMTKGEHWPIWPDLGKAKVDFKQRYAGMGQLSEAQWTEFTRNSLQRGQDGQYRQNFDPRILESLRGFQCLDRLTPEFMAQPIRLWLSMMDPVATTLFNYRDVFDQVRAKTLILRGQDSPILTRSTAEAMQRQGRPGQVTLREIPGTGHAPALLDPAQQRLIGDFIADEGSPVEGSCSGRR